MPKNLGPVLIGGAVVIVAIVLVIFFLPQYTSRPCIQIPKELSAEDAKKALDLKGELEATVKGKGDVAAKYDTVVRDNFAKLSQRNMTLYLFSQAIDCYLKHGDQASKEVAKIMAETLRAELARSGGHASLTGPLTAEEEAEIKKSPYANVILEALSLARQ
jgi:hypothetical protein